MDSKSPSSPPIPQTFSQIFSTYSLMDPQNATVFRLSHNVEGQRKLILALNKFLNAPEQHPKFVNLVNRVGQARIAMALYAGDGIVVKITPVEFMPTHKNLPLVMPPFEQTIVDCGNDIGEFAIEMYPYLDTRDIRESHVTEMKKILDIDHLQFNLYDKDDKPDNVGRLRDNRLAILDGDAVHPKKGYDAQEMKMRSEEWLNKIHKMYPRLYAPGFVYAQTPETDFAIHPRIPAPLKHAEILAGTVPSHWYDRIGPKFFGHRGK